MTSPVASDITIRIPPCGVQSVTQYPLYFHDPSQDVDSDSALESVALTDVSMQSGPSPGPESELDLGASAGTTPLSLRATAPVLCALGTKCLSMCHLVPSLGSGHT